MPCLLVVSSVSGGCSFKDQMESTQSSFQDLDQAKLAAKMALAHKGLDIEVLKKRQARYLNVTLNISIIIYSKHCLNKFVFQH